MNETGGTVQEKIQAITTRSRQAARVLATASRQLKDHALHTMADALVLECNIILEANAEDLRRAQASNMADGQIDRLTLSPARIESIAAALRELAGLPDPVGQVIKGSTLPNGLRIRQVRVPMGVVGMIYEARPNVTVDAAGLGLKSGNAVILRGGSAAELTNTAIVEVLGNALEFVGLPRDSVQSIDAFGRQGAVELMRARGQVDVLVPRGGVGLIQTVVMEATVPVIETGAGNCHVYVDRDVDQANALAIVLNSKTHRVSVCNAAETLLVHRERAGDFLPTVLSELSAAGVVIHGDAAVRSAAPDGVTVLSATEQDWAGEYLAMEMAVAVVGDIDAAIQHIATWSTGHTEAICTTSLPASEQFAAQVDSAVVNVNASTRFTDGGEFGLGAEIGISTQKLHARGPMGMTELTTTKWIVNGSGQIRE